MAGKFDARELFRVLTEHKVAYVTIGGVAIQAYGGQRLTQDLDVVVGSSQSNCGLLAAALTELDARTLGPDGRHSDSVPSASLRASDDQWHLISPHGRIDVITLAARLGPFEEMRKRTRIVPLGEKHVPIASREDLLELKRAAGRPQDLADIRLLESLDDGSK